MRKLSIALVALLALALLLAACGGGDDDDDADDDDGGSTPTATATATGDGNGGAATAASGDGGSSSGGGNTEERYASALCTAIRDFVNVLPSAMNQEQMTRGDFSSLAEPFSELADRLEAADPPDYLEAYHQGLAQAIRLQAEAFKEGGLDALGRIDELTDFPQPSEAEARRFASAVSGVQACAESGFLGGS